MSRLKTLAIDEATGDLAKTFAVVRKAVGKVPNAYATIGSNVPALLQQMLAMGAVLKTDSGLDARELEAINLAISEDSGCDYCVAAHTLVAKAAGFTMAQTRALREGSLPGEPRIDALVKFCLELVHTTGTLPDRTLEDVRRAGYSDQQIVGAVAAVSAILLTNMLNRVNDTTLDFPSPD